VTWQYTFDALGSNDVFLVVTDDGEPALSDTVSKVIDVLDQFPPEASFAADPMSGTFPFPLQVDFDASASHDQDGVIVSYDWDFGDGGDSAMTTPFVSHIYASPGQGALTVTLTVTDDDGATDSDSHNLIFFEEGGELQVSDLSPPNYEVAKLVEGDEYYVDRSFTIVDIPSEYEGLWWIKTANDDKDQTSEAFLTFTVNRDVTAYVAYDHRASGLPLWITDYYTQQGVGIGVTDGASPLQVWARDFPAGSVVMGANMAGGASGAGSMYVVLLGGQGAVVDTLAPVISQVATAGVIDSAATIEWTTDEPADSRVEFGLAPGSYVWFVEDALLVLSHSLELTGLTPATQYHYRVRSQDVWGNASTSQDMTFTTTHELPGIPGQPIHFDD
jgi:PKD repeat protein